MMRSKSHCWTNRARSMWKWCISENISPVSKSRHSKQVSRNLRLTGRSTVSKSWTFIIRSRIVKQASRSLGFTIYTPIALFLTAKYHGNIKISRFIWYFDILQSRTLVENGDLSHVGSSLLSSTPGRKETKLNQTLKQRCSNTVERRLSGLVGTSINNPDNRN